MRSSSTRCARPQSFGGSQGVRGAGREAAVIIEHWIESGVPAKPGRGSVPYEPGRRPLP